MAISPRRTASALVLLGLSATCGCSVAIVAVPQSLQSRPSTDLVRIAELSQACKETTVWTCRRESSHVATSRCSCSK
jgi:hypothetical protein